MLEIEIRRPREGVCAECSGTGIVIPKDGEKRLVEVGKFCDKCSEGVGRWEATLKIKDALNHWKI